MGHPLVPAPASNRAPAGDCLCPGCVSSPRGFFSPPAFTLSEFSSAAVSLSGGYYNCSSRNSILTSHIRARGSHLRVINPRVGPTLRSAPGFDTTPKAPRTYNGTVIGVNTLFHTPVSPHHRCRSRTSSGFASTNLVPASAILLQVHALPSGARPARALQCAHPAIGVVSEHAGAGAVPSRKDTCLLLPPDAADE